MQLKDVRNHIIWHYNINDANLLRILRACYGWLRLLPDEIDWIDDVIMNFDRSKTVHIMSSVSVGNEYIELPKPLALIHKGIKPMSDRYTVLLSEWIAHCALEFKYYTCNSSVLAEMCEGRKFTQNVFYDWNWINPQDTSDIDSGSIQIRVDRLINQRDLAQYTHLVNKFHNSEVEHSSSYYFKDKTLYSYGQLLERMFKACYDSEDDCDKVFKVFSQRNNYACLSDTLLSFYHGMPSADNTILNQLVIYAAISGYKLDRIEDLICVVHLEDYYPKEMREWFEQFPTRSALVDAVCTLLGNDAKDKAIMSWLNQLST